MLSAHLRGANADVRDVVQSLAVYSINAKVARKNNETHLFVEHASASSLDEFCAAASASAASASTSSASTSSAIASSTNASSTNASSTNASATSASTSASAASARWTKCPGCELCAGSRPKAKPQSTKRLALYPPLILLPTGSQADAEDAQKVLASHPKFTHVAVNAPIQVGDPVRRPKLVPLAGDFGAFTPSPRPSAQDLRSAFWCTSVQNGIYQTWAPMYTMFSRGNITEKKRVLTEFASQTPIAGNTVVDLYAGIGYFTLSYAKNNPKLVYCWELNWWSVEGLLRAAKQNKISARAVYEHEEYVPQPDDCIVVFVEDNQRALQRLPRLDLANLSHINMGLLPDCHEAFPVALELAQHSSQAPVFHIHENVRIVKLNEWTREMSEKFGDCLHVEKIKSYSPGVVHVCGDFAYKA